MCYQGLNSCHALTQCMQKKLLHPRLFRIKSNNPSFGNAAICCHRNVRQKIKIILKVWLQKEEKRSSEARTHRWGANFLATGQDLNNSNKKKHDSQIQTERCSTTHTFTEPTQRLNIINQSFWSQTSLWEDRQCKTYIKIYLCSILYRAAGKPPARSLYSNTALVWISFPGQKSHPAKLNVSCKQQLKYCTFAVPALNLVAHTP